MDTTTAILLFSSAFLALSAMLFPAIRQNSHSLAYALCCLLLMALPCGAAASHAVRISLGVVSILFVVPLCLYLLSLSKKDAAVHKRKKRKKD